MSTLQIVFIVLAIIVGIGYVIKFDANKAIYAIGFPGTLIFVAIREPLINKYLQEHPLETQSAIIVMGAIVFQFYLYTAMVFVKKVPKVEQNVVAVPAKILTIEDVVKRSKPLYKFTISSSEGTHVVKANHPDEVWGEIWSEDYPPTDAKIVEVVDNDDEDEE